MAFAAIHNHNPFTVPLLLFASILALRYYLLSRPDRYGLRKYASKLGRRSVVVLGVLLGMCLVLMPAFELYFSVFECEVSKRYMAENGALARRLLAVLAAHRIPVWLDYATLLNQLRNQQLNRWEQDVDLSIIYPEHYASLRDFPLLPGGQTVGSAWDAAVANPSAPGLALSKEHLMAKLTAEGFRCTWDKRNLIQVWGPSPRGPHVDLWLWTPLPPGQEVGPVAAVASTQYSPTRDADSLRFWTAEDAHYNPRPYNELFPLQYDTASWLGMPITMPAQPHALSAQEYGSYGGSYMEAQVFRGDCFHNFFQLRFAY